MKWTLDRDTFDETVNCHVWIKIELLSKALNLSRSCFSFLKASINHENDTVTQSFNSLSYARWVTSQFGCCFIANIVRATWGILGPLSSSFQILPVGDSSVFADRPQDWRTSISLAFHWPLFNFCSQQDFIPSYGREQRDRKQFTLTFSWHSFPGRLKTRASRIIRLWKANSKKAKVRNTRVRATPWHINILYKYVDTRRSTVICDILTEHVIPKPWALMCCYNSLRFWNLTAGESNIKMPLPRG